MSRCAARFPRRPAPCPASTAPRRRRSWRAPARWCSGPDRATRRTGIAIDVDHGARDGGVDRGGAQVAHEIVELVDPPVGVLARQPRRHAARLDVGRDLGAGVRKADDQRRLALLDGEPCWVIRHHATSDVIPALACRDPAGRRAPRAALKMRSRTLGSQDDERRLRAWLQRIFSSTPPAAAMPAASATAPERTRSAAAAMSGAR